MMSVQSQRFRQRKGTDMGSETHQRRGKRTKRKIDATRFKRIRRKISRRKDPKIKGSKRGGKKIRKRPRTLRRKRQWKEKRGNSDDKVDLFFSKAYKQQYYNRQVIPDLDSQLGQYDQGFYQLSSHHTSQMFYLGQKNNF